MSFSQKELSNLNQLVKDFDPAKLTAEVIVIGEEWADQDAAASSLEETKKPLFAKIALENLTLGAKSGNVGERPKAMSAAAAELHALSDPRYEQHLELMVQARKEANRLRVRYDMGKMKLELMRSLQANMRNEMRMSGQFT